MGLDRCLPSRCGWQRSLKLTLMGSKIPLWQSLLKELRLAVANVEGGPLGSMNSDLPRQPQRQARLRHKLMLQEGCTGGPLCRILHSSMTQGWSPSRLGRSSATHSRDQHLTWRRLPPADGDAST